MSLRRGPSLRAFLIGLVAAGVAYVGIIALIVAREVGPGSIQPRNDTEAILAVHRSFNDRVRELERTTTDLRNTRRALIRGDPVDSAEMNRLAGVTRVLEDSPWVSGLGSNRDRIPVAMRPAFDSATSAEAAMTAATIVAYRAIAQDRLDDASTWLFETNEQRQVIESALTAVQGQAIRDVIVREQALQRAAEVAIRAVAWWLAIGSVIVAAAIVLIRHRFYMPLQRLERSLHDVSQGDLETTVPVARDDEFGRLGTLFNQMTGVLREREAEERRRRVDIAERFGRIIDESSGEVLLFDASTLQLEHANRVRSQRCDGRLRI